MIAFEDANELERAAAAIIAVLNFIASLDLTVESETVVWIADGQANITEPQSRRYLIWYTQDIYTQDIHPQIQVREILYRY